MTRPPVFWNTPVEELLDRLLTRSGGLSSEEALERHKEAASMRLKPRREIQPLRLLLSQFRNPLVLILLFAATVSVFLSDPIDALIILAIILASALLGFWQEHGAAKAVASLLALVKVTTEVWRQGELIEIPLEDIVPGDVIRLSAGSSVPGDGRLLESKDLFIDEATLTGET